MYTAPGPVKDLQCLGRAVVWEQPDTTKCETLRYQLAFKEPGEEAKTANKEQTFFILDEERTPILAELSGTITIEVSLIR